MELTVRWLSSRQRGEVERLWTGLEAQFGARVSCSWAWTGTWLDHYGAVVKHRYAVIEADGRPRGIVLVTCSDRAAHGVRLRILHLGTAGEPDDETVFVQYNALLVDPVLRGPAARALMASLERLRWHELRLDGFVPEDADALFAARTGAHPDRQVCRIVDLTPPGDELLAGFSPAVRKVLRRGLRRSGEVEAVPATSVDQALDILAELKTLSDARWAAEDRAGAFESPRFVAFHRGLVARLVPEGRAVLLRVRDADGTLGCGYALVDGRTALAYQVGRRTDEDSRVSAGQLVELLLMRACAAKGLAVYSHQSGDTEHKRRLSTGAEELVWARWRRGRALVLHRAAEALAGRVRR
jgi:CelD/BcsL family acetyltransferase involved in cellulose biosynthesis